MDVTCNTTNLPASKAKKGHGDQSPSKSNSATQKKLVHRENERHRRQDMAKLYASLRDLLPLEFIKGKRSTSGHTHQAANYVKYVQESIKVLSVKRDKLKKFTKMSVPSGLGNTSESLMNLLPITVSISSCNRGVEILINSCSIEDGFALSGVLKELFDEGLHVISCTPTKVSDLAWTDLFMLQQRLTAIANNLNDFS